MSAVPPSAPPTLSLLQEMIEAFERETRMRISLDDLTGVTTGVHEDVPTMRLDFDHQQHVCKFCLFAKSTDQGHTDCVRNKIAINRIVVRRRKGIKGHCHLGLFDIAEPLTYQGEILGVFYGGSVVVRGTEELTRARILRYCVRHGIDPQLHLDKLAAVPVIEPEQIAAHRQSLRLIARTAEFFYETCGVRPELYQRRPLKFPYNDPLAMPFVVKATLQYVREHLHEPFSVKDVAARLRCHPDFLSRKFKQHAGIDLSFYLQQARIERAKKLLENPRMTIEDASGQSGFSDRFHFSKVFRRLTGGSPGAYQREMLAAKTEPTSV